jgi:peptidoglycan/xylan/chitin deacetylase (PgdA/CDA1 family)
MQRYRVDPEQFEQQLKYLSDSGYYSVTWEKWLQAMFTRRPLEGRPIAITFDDGYTDFYQYAWPLLKKYGFSATVFLVTDLVGKANTWDEVYGEHIQLMDWNEIKELHDQGIEFGSHSANHKALTSLTPDEIVKEGIISRSTLKQQLDARVDIIAYPYGDTDPVVAHLMGACGYTIGLSCRTGFSTFLDNSMDLPRIEIKGSDNLKTFVSKLH